MILFMHQFGFMIYFNRFFLGEEPHGEKAAEWAKEHLGKLGFPARKIADVSYAVKVHSCKPGYINKDILEACILWDADKLTKISPYNLLFNLFTKVRAQDCIENINTNNYKTNQITIFELIKNEIKPLLLNDPIDMFYFDVSNKKANDLRKTANCYYQTLIDHVTISEL